MLPIKEKKRPVEREVPIDLRPEEFRLLGYRLIDRITEHLETIREQRVSPAQSAQAVRELIGSERGLPETGSDAGELLEGASRLLFENSLFNGHPRFWGYITASGAPIGILADTLAAAVNSNVGGFTLAPVATEIEAQTVRWIADLIGYPTSCGGLLTSGGNLANIHCLLAARARAGGETLRQEGLAGSEKAAYRIYASAETHTWIQKAADVAGLGTQAVRWIATDRYFRIRPDLLRESIRADREAGAVPLMVVGTAGSVSTGAIDPLSELAAICREEELWFHVDGAYGAPAAAVPSLAESFDGLAEADSVAVDPHKWLYAPLEAGCVLVKDPATLRAAFSYHPSYYHFDPELTNYFDHGLQNSRGFRALKVWLALQQAGRQGYARMIGDDIQLSRRLFERLKDWPELQPFTQNLSIATFRYCPDELLERSDEKPVASYLNDLNKEILDRIEASGEAFLSNAVLDGNFLLRMCIVNFRTTEEDIAGLPELVCKIGREVDAQMRLTS